MMGSLEWLIILLTQLGSIIPYIQQTTRVLDTAHRCLIIEYFHHSRQNLPVMIKNTDEKETTAILVHGENRVTVPDMLEYHIRDLLREYMFGQEISLLMFTNLRNDIIHNHKYHIASTE